uniref:Galanin message associated peptide (GMAP) domain-containing protein n=1 Tax=Suricata suricatta TaxID=37032 RepID=A0A673U3H3_SURSU
MTWKNKCVFRDIGPLPFRCPRETPGSGASTPGAPGRPPRSPPAWGAPRFGRVPASRGGPGLRPWHKLFAARESARPSCSGTGRAGHCGNGHGSPLCPETDAVDNHRPFQEKPGLTGKRELPPEDAARPGSFARPMSEDAVVRTIIEFLTFLRLKGLWLAARSPERAIR